MKFFLARGDQVKEKLAELPAYWRRFFRFSKILVFCTADDHVIVGACGIVSISNYIGGYVKEEYRRKGLGPLLYKKAIEVARNQNLSFIHASVSTFRVPIIYFMRSILGFREIILLEKINYDFLMLPLTYRGELLYTFLHVVCSKLPESLVSYTIDFFMYVFGRIRAKMIDSV